MRRVQSLGPEILVVEDDTTTRFAIAQVLRRQGYSVADAANGREAIRHLKNVGLARLILLDLVMPEMDGWQFQEELKQDPSLAAIPVIVLSADDPAARQAAPPEAAGFLLKPVEFDDLMKTVKQFL